MAKKEDGSERAAGKKGVKAKMELQHPPGELKNHFLEVTETARILKVNDHLSMVEINRNVFTVEIIDGAGILERRRNDREEPDGEDI
ncbi:MAG: hypothetical protein LBR53_11865 [Deltaproteobacteria bacterium]|nr:hypothetical protein [Deltaproteobacteria bacterium]